ncbi:MAG: hypothetical protein K6F09_04960 [Clostridiales bacterium]|nr:hypothetical protein [Clostridiales bacterium]
MLIQSDMPNVIRAKNCKREKDQYVMYRKRFSVPKKGDFSICLFADTYYNLYVDGVFINRGPVRRHENSAEYDEINVRLKSGTHCVCALVHRLGVECAGHRIGKNGFWCVIEGGGLRILSDGTWKAEYLDAFDSDLAVFSHYDFRENVDLRLLPPDFFKTDFDDSSRDGAEILYKAGSSEDFYNNYSLRKMKLFSYVLRKSSVIKSGYYKETLPQGEYFFDRLVSRKTVNSVGDGSFIAADLGVTVSGTAIVEYSDAADGTELIIGYDDTLDKNGMIDSGRCMRCADRFILPAGDGKAEVFMPRGFRYLLVHVSGDCKIKAVSAREEVYPYLPKSFSFGDRYFDTLYSQSLRTQRICTVDGFVDCVNRERVLWLGDAMLDSLGAYYAEPDMGLLLTTICEHAAGQHISGALGGYNSSNLSPEWLLMAPYNLMFLNMLCDFILFTGDEKDILPMKDTAAGILKFIASNFNGDGLFDVDMNDCSNYWDWGYPDAKGQSLKTNAYFIYTVSRMSRFDFFLDTVKPYVSMLPDMKEKCFKIFWDEKRRLFHDGCVKGEKPDELSTQLANALAILSGVCPDSLKIELAERMTDPNELDAVPVGENQDGNEFVPDKKKILPSGTMYSAFFVAEALFEAGRYDLAISYIKEVWGPFEKLPTLPELRINGATNTMCHGWSGGPSYLLPRYLLGLHPASNGFQRSVLTLPDVSPNVLSSAEGIVPTPFGDITVCWYNLDGAYKVMIKAPDGVSVEVKKNGRSVSFDSPVQLEKILFI